MSFTLVGSPKPSLGISTVLPCERSGLGFGFGKGAVWFGSVSFGLVLRIQLPSEFQAVLRGFRGTFVPSWKVVGSLGKLWFWDMFQVLTAIAAI